MDGRNIGESREMDDEPARWNESVNSFARRLTIDCQRGTPESACVEKPRTTCGSRQNKNWIVARPLVLKQEDECSNQRWAQQ